MAYTAFSQVNLAAIINEVWSPVIEREWQSKLIFANFMKNVSDQYAFF